MIERLVWNFEFVSSHFSFSDLAHKKEAPLKWEARCFWPQAEIIQFARLDSALLELVNYQYKQKCDVYYLIPNGSYNIKKRRDELLYKPIIKKNKYSIAYDQKINLMEPGEVFANNQLDLEDLLKQAQQGQPVLVNKESFVYKFPTQPLIKLELSRIQFNGTHYFSACVEGKSRYLVETISQSLWGKRIIFDYITFLKSVAQS